MIVVQDVLISDDIATQKFACDIAKCKGACCVEGDYGAPLESKELGLIDENLQKILPFLPQRSQDFLSQNQGYQYHEEAKKDVTDCHEDGTCVFANVLPSGIIICGIESAFRQGEIDFIKPISCHLYPIRVSRNDIMGFEAWNYDEWSICAAACQRGSTEKIPLFVFLKDAIIRAKGIDFYEELSAAIAYSNEATDGEQF